MTRGSSAACRRAFTAALTNVSGPMPWQALSAQPAPARGEVATSSNSKVSGGVLSADAL